MKFSAVRNVIINPFRLLQIRESCTQSGTLVTIYHYSLAISPLNISILASFFLFLFSLTPSLALPFLPLHSKKLTLVLPGAYATDFHNNMHSSPGGIILLLTGVFACFTTSFSIFLSFSPTKVMDLVCRSVCRSVTFNKINAIHPYTCSCTLYTYIELYRQSRVEIKHYSVNAGGTEFSAETNLSGHCLLVLDCYRAIAYPCNEVCA